MIIITQFESYVCGPDTPIREVLARIDRSKYLFQIVLDKGNKLLGTITDGDIRRAMLQDIGLDKPVNLAMQTSPVVGRVDDGTRNHEKLRRTGSSRAFLPVIDGNDILREIQVAQNIHDDGVRTALVMAGGPGTRLGERTRNTPKPLLPVGGRPIMEHVLQGLESSGVGTILVSVHYLADQIEKFIKGRSNSAQIEVVHEPVRLGTAGAVGQLGSRTTGVSLLVVNGDVLTNVDYTALHEFHVRHGHDATVGVARYEVDVPFGVVRYSEDGLFASIEEKPRITNFIAAGIYYLSPEIVALVPKDRPMDMPELLNLARGIGLRIGVFPIHEYWTDIGRPDDLKRAEDLHRSITEVR